MAEKEPIMMAMVIDEMAKTEKSFIDCIFNFKLPITLIVILLLIY